MDVVNDGDGDLHCLNLRAPKKKLADRNGSQLPPH